MQQQRRGRNWQTLLMTILLAGAYGGWLYTQRTLTGTSRGDGIIGVLLGLYICSHPAANFLDLLFFSRGAQRQTSSLPSTIFWLALNLLVLLVGWSVIFIGATRLVALTVH
ncbi:MAG: hypothetical protein FJZ89_08005 [Chloroflexi bacterium]|nr:hypothetical protein [Chloroflexota bacterium]